MAKTTGNGSTDHPVRYEVNLRLETALNPEHVSLVEGRLSSSTSVSPAGRLKGFWSQLTTRLRGKRN